jgi:nucleoside phosphorylase
MEVTAGELWGRLAADLGSGGDDAVNRLADAALRAPTPAAAQGLIRALTVAESESSKRAAALALANAASPEDPDAADALDDAYREARCDPSLGPTLLKALGLYALRSTTARAAAAAGIQKLRPGDPSHLLVAGAKVIGLLVGQREDVDLRRKLDSLTESDDPGVESEACQQLALLALADAFHRQSLDDIVAGLKEARAGFAAAEALEEVRPDAELFGRLTDLVLEFDAFVGGGGGSLDEVRRLVAEVRGSVGRLGHRVFQGYRSDAANHLTERVLRIADSLGAASDELAEARVWVDLNAAVVMLAEAHACILARPAAFLGQERVEAAMDGVAEAVMRPRLGPVLLRFVGRDRLARVIENYEKRSGDEGVLRSLRVLQEVTNATDREGGPKLSPDQHAALAALAERAGMTPDELVSDIAVVIQRGEAEGWAVRVGLASPATDQPSRRDGGGAGMSEDASREYLAKVADLKGLLADRSRNGTPSEEEYRRLRAELVAVAVIRDALPSFVLKCRTIEEFWAFIKQKYGTWKERLEFLQREFDPLMTGLERGEVPSGQETPAALVASPTAPRPDVLLVTVNEHETRAIHNEFELATGRAAIPVSLGGRVYRNLGEVNGTMVFHALSEMGSGGVGAMQQTVDKAIRALDPGAVIAVGIAFGVNERKQSIGDILLSKQLRPYDLQRVGVKGEVRLRGDKPHATPRLIDHFDGFRQTTWGGTKVIPGVLLTGEKLIDDIDYRDSLIAIEAEAIGGEMEGIGLYVPCHEHKVDWIVIKAICDWADGNKRVNKERRQQKAASKAAQFLVKALQYAPLKRSI